MAKSELNLIKFFSTRAVRFVHFMKPTIAVARSVCQTITFTKSDRRIRTT